MKKILFPLAATLLMMTVSYSHADNVSISVGQPGFYGRIDVGGYPAPQLIYSQPVFAQGAPYGGSPVYLYAPPKHIHHWDKYCRRYGACGAPVYFVQDRWYKQVYVPQYRHGHGYDRGHKHGRHHHDDD
jgi:hypothetical protein